MLELMDVFIVVVSMAALAENAFGLAEMLLGM